MKKVLIEYLHNTAAIERIDNVNKLSCFSVDIRSPGPFENKPNILGIILEVKKKIITA